MDVIVQEFARELRHLARRTIASNEVAEACAEAIRWHGAGAAIVNVLDALGRVGRSRPSTPPVPRVTAALEADIVRAFEAEGDVILDLELVEVAALIRCMWALQAYDVLRLFREVNRRGPRHAHVDAILREAMIRPPTPGPKNKKFRYGRT